jgi:hypothetical protein
MQVLYTQSDGSKLIYQHTQGDLMYGYVMRPDGRQFETAPVQSIIARGYWEVAEEVFKHQEHDQSTHGSWASGEASNFIGEGEIAAKYKDYKLDDLESGKISWYIQNGVRLNKELRADQTNQELIKKAVQEIDAAIERAPKFPNREVYRVAPSFLMDGMKVGTVIQDLGYQSTTVADLTKPENGVLLLSLSTVSSGQKALTRINLGSEGKGLYLPAVSKDPVSAHEREFLLPRGTKLRYTGNEKIQSSVIHTFEVVNDK